MPDNKPEISIHEIIVNGRRFFCSFSEKKAFSDFVEKIKGEEVKVTYLHSVKASLDKRDDKAEYCYATATLTKSQALDIFEGMARRSRDISNLIGSKIADCPEAVNLVKFIASLKHKESDILFGEFSDFVFNKVMGADDKETEESYKKFQTHLERIIKKE